MMKTTRRFLASLVLLSGVGLWVCAAGTSAFAAAGPVVEEAQPAACYANCKTNAECEIRCGGPGSGVCQGNYGCTTCACTQ